MFCFTQLRLKQPYNAPCHGFSGKNSDRHLRQLVLDGPEISNRQTKRLALFGILNARGKNAFGCAHYSRPELKPTDIENVERNHMSATDFTQHVLNWHFYVVKVNG